MTKDPIDRLQTEWAEQRPDLDPDGMDVILRIQFLARSMARRTADSLADVGLEWWEYDVLSALRRQGSPFRLSASALCRETNLSTGAMTNRIDRLEARDLVRRATSADDRRSVEITLTAVGRRLIDAAVGLRFDAARQSLSAVSAAERKRLAGLLRRLVLANPG